MKKLFLIFTILLISLSVSKADIFRIENAIPTGLGSVISPDFGGDVLVANANPIGPISGVRGQNGNVYMCINDTLLTSNLGLIIAQSSNNGNNWTLFPSGITLRTKYDQVKMIKTADSMLCYFRVGGLLVRWNPLSGFVNILSMTSNAADFDVAVSSTNSVYVFYQTTGDTIRRWGSTDGGITFPNSGTLTTNGSRPRLCFSPLGDTLIVNYRGPVRPGLPNKSIVRSGLIRELAPATLFSVSLSFADVITDTSSAVNEYKSIKYGPNVWTFYTKDTAGSTDLRCAISTSGGTIYLPHFSIASAPGRNEYWFDAASSNVGIFGKVDLVYTSDSVQSGAPTNTTDKLMFTSSTTELPAVFSAPVQFSNFPPMSTINDSKPSVVELPSGDIGFAFIGYTAGGNKVYWDRLLQLTSISNNGNITPDKFELKQNYPNPFNPATNIVFNLSKNSFVNLKVYDMSGKEVAKLVSQNMNQGNYTVTFDGKNLSSGVYFYKLESDNFSEVKKMSLIK